MSQRAALTALAGCHADGVAGGGHVGSAGGADPSPASGANSGGEFRHAGVVGDMPASQRPFTECVACRQADREQRAADERFRSDERVRWEEEMEVATAACAAAEQEATRLRGEVSHVRPLSSGSPPTLSPPRRSNHRHVQLERVGAGPRDGASGSSTDALSAKAEAATARTDGAAYRAMAQDAHRRLEAVNAQVCGSLGASVTPFLPPPSATPHDRVCLHACSFGLSKRRRASCWRR